MPNEKPALLSDELPRCWIRRLNSLAHLQKTANSCPHCCEGVCKPPFGLCLSGKLKASKSSRHLVLQFSAGKAVKLGLRLYSIGTCYCCGYLHLASGLAAPFAQCFVCFVMDDVCAVYVQTSFPRNTQN